MQPTQVPAQEQRSLGELVAELSQETGTLVRKEVALAKVEISEKVSQVTSGVGSLAVGAVVLLAGFIVLLDSAVLGLAKFLPPERFWLAPLIVGVVVLVVGFVLLQKGKSNLKPAHLAPRKTVESLQKDKELVKEQLK